LDTNGDKTLDVHELTAAFAKHGKKPALSEVYAMIAEVDTTGKKTVDFNEFCNMMVKVKKGDMPSGALFPSLITSALEDFIVAANKKPEKNIPTKIGGKGGGEAQPEKPQGEKYIIKKKGPQRKIYKNLPAKKDLTELP